MIFIIDKLVNGTNEDFLSIIPRPFVNPKVLQIRMRCGPLILENQYNPNLFQDVVLSS